MYGKSGYLPEWEIRIFTYMGNLDIHLYGKSGYSLVWEISIFTYMGNQYIYLYGKSVYLPIWEISIFTYMGNLVPVLNMFSTFVKGLTEIHYILPPSSLNIKYNFTRFCLYSLGLYITEGKKWDIKTSKGKFFNSYYFYLEINLISPKIFIFLNSAKKAKRFFTLRANKHNICREKNFKKGEMIFREIINPCHYFM